MCVRACVYPLLGCPSKEMFHVIYKLYSKCSALIMKSEFKRNKGVLPSFPHPLVTGDRSTQTHPALLWSLRKRESSRLKNKQQRAFFYSMANDRRGSICLISALHLHSQRFERSREFCTSSFDKHALRRDARRDFCLRGFRLHSLLLAGGLRMPWLSIIYQWRK